MRVLSTPVLFTDMANKALVRTFHEVRRRKPDCAEPEHILLGVLSTDFCIALNILGRLKVSRTDVLPKLFEEQATVDDVAAPGTIPQSSSFGRVLNFAEDEAKASKLNFVGTEHLLLGILIVKECMAAQILGDLGVTIEKVRQQIQGQIGRPDEDGEALIFPDSHFIRLPDDSVIHMAEDMFAVLTHISSDGHTRPINIYRFICACSESKRKREEERLSKSGG